MFKIKLAIARYFVGKYADKNIDNLAIPLASFRTFKQLLFVEPTKIRNYCK